MSNIGSESSPGLKKGPAQPQNVLNLEITNSQWVSKENNMNNDIKEDCNPQVEMTMPEPEQSFYVEIMPQKFIRLAN